MIATIEESVFLSMVSTAPGARDIPVVVMTHEIRDLIEYRHGGADRVNTLRWSFVGASHPSEACVLLDLDDADAVGIMNGLGPLNFHLSETHSVQMYPSRMITVAYATSTTANVKGLRILYLTDLRGLKTGTFAFGGLSTGESWSQPKVINQTLDMPFHFAGVTAWTSTTLTTTQGLTHTPPAGQPAIGNTPITISYQQTDSVVKLFSLGAYLGIGPTVGTGAFFDGVTIQQAPPIELGAPSWSTGSAVASAVPAPIDFPAGSFDPLQAWDAALSERGWMQLCIPTWNGAVYRAGVPINPAVAGSITLWRDRLASFVNADITWSGSFASAEPLAGGLVMTRASTITIASGLVPAPNLTQSITRGSAAWLLRQMPDLVIPTFQRGSVRSQFVGTSTPGGIFNYQILPGARTSGMLLDANGATVNRRRWQYGAIPPNASPEYKPDASPIPTGSRVMRLELSDYAVLAGDEDFTQRPINLDTTTALGTAIQNHFKLGTVTMLAQNAAKNFYGRFLAPQGEATMHGLVVFDHFNWWPGIQYAEWTFGREGISTTRVWGDFWHPCFGFVATKRVGDHWEIDDDRQVTAAGTNDGSAIAGVPRIRGDVAPGHIQVFLARVIESKPWRYDYPYGVPAPELPGTGLPVAWIYRVGIVHPNVESYGFRTSVDGGQTFVLPENTGNMILDPNYSDLWVINLNESRNSGEVSGVPGLHGTGTEVIYSGTGTKVTSQPIRNGMPVHLFAVQTEAGGTYYYINEGAPYKVECPPPEAQSVTPGTYVDPLSEFTGGLVRSVPDSMTTSAVTMNAVGAGCSSCGSGPCACGGH